MVLIIEDYYHNYYHNFVSRKIQNSSILKVLELIYIDVNSVDKFNENRNLNKYIKYIDENYEIFILIYEMFKKKYGYYSFGYNQKHILDLLNKLRSTSSKDSEELVDDIINLTKSEFIIFNNIKNIDEKRNNFSYVIGIASFILTVISFVITFSSV